MIGPYELDILLFFLGSFGHENFSGQFWPRLPMVKVLVVLAMVTLLATLAMNANIKRFPTTVGQG